VQQSPKKLTVGEAKQKIYNYCVYQERTHLEVKNRLYKFGLHTNEVDELLSHLIVEGYLNEERFAKAFAGGKFRLKKWGRLKIINELESRGLTNNCIRSGMKEIEEADYERTLQTLLLKKADLLSDDDRFAKRDKLARFGIQKGFESELVWKMVKVIVAE
jgi:regulatory protein